MSLKKGIRAVSNFIALIPTLFCQMLTISSGVDLLRNASKSRGGGVLPYMGYIGMCRCEGYGFQAVYSRIGYINQNIWV